MKYCEEIITEIAGYIERGLSQADAAELAGIGERTLYTWLNDPQKEQFQQAIKKARS